jgi:uncharacterized protein Smg (DUF494 family)
MNLYPFSTEQINVIDSELSLANISYVDDHVALETLFARLLKNVANNKASVVVCPSDIQKITLVKMFESRGLEPLVLNKNLLESVTESAFVSLYQRFLIPPQNTKSDQESAFKLLRLYEKIKNNYLQKYEVDEEAKSWRKYLDTYLNLTEQSADVVLSTCLDVAHFDFSEQELDDIKSIIADVLFIYDRSFELYEVEHELFGLNTTSHITEKLPDISFELFSFKEAVLDIRDQYAHFYTITFINNFRLYYR